MATESRSVLWVDAGAGQRITRINSDGGFASAFPALLAASNADWVQEWESTLAVNVLPAPTVADYQSVAAVATFVFSTAGASLVQLRVPAPKLAMFLADGRTIDATQADAAALIAACVGVLSDESGNTALAFVAGFLG